MSMGSIQLFPPVVQPRTLTRQVWDAQTARSLPGVARALGIYELVMQCALRQMRGSQLLPSTSFLVQPDPDLALPNFIRMHVDDYWLHGNAAHLVTARDSDGLPAACRWYPAQDWWVGPDHELGGPAYWLRGRRVRRREDVVHVQRGADPVNPWRGVGVVEQHVRSLNRAGLQEEAESANLRERGMPAVAIITPMFEPDEKDMDAAADKWAEKFAGPEPRPAFLPKDSEVVPLSWNPDQSQMAQARELTLKDTANMWNLDGYWIGASTSSHTYRSPGPMFLVLLRISLNPMMVVFEDIWSRHWLPRGRRVELDRSVLTSDDVNTMINAFRLDAGRLFPDPDEARAYMGFPPLTDDQKAMWLPGAVGGQDEPPAPEPDPEPDPDIEPGQEE